LTDRIAKAVSGRKRPAAERSADGRSDDAS
jgi:hypothetical protein